MKYRPDSFGPAVWISSLFFPHRNNEILHPCNCPSAIHAAFGAATSATPSKVLR